MALARRSGAPGDRGHLVAAAGAPVFALEPVQTEAVTYVSGRSVSLAALFALASVLAWIRGRERASPWLTLIASPAFFAAALLVKETSLVVPAAIALWELTAPRRKPLRDLAPMRGHLVVASLAVAAAVASPTYRLLAATSLETLDRLEPGDASRSDRLPGGQLDRPDRLNADHLRSSRDYATSAAVGSVMPPWRSGSRSSEGRPRSGSASCGSSSGRPHELVRPTPRRRQRSPALPRAHGMTWMSRMLHRLIGTDVSCSRRSWPG
jgi:hypothetical protein